MDHGIESAEERIAAGKSPEGTIRLSAEQKGARIVVRVSDEGGVVAGRGGKSDGSLGLAGLRERVESLGGTFSVSRLRHGTTIEMSVALGEGEEA